MTKLRDLATVLRSKNAGAFVLTLDIMFESEEVLQAVINSGALAEDRIAAQYRIDAKEVTVEAAPNARAIKISFPRPVPSGHLGDTDIYGAVQYIPLLDLEVKNVSQ